jgi:phospholipid-transporting ATPase
MYQQIRQQKQGVADMACVCLFCCFQGADTVIYERLAHKHPLNAKLKEVTQQHMEDFGSAGLRTLCLAYTELDPDFYDK